MRKQEIEAATKNSTMTILDSKQTTNAEEMALTCPNTQFPKTHFKPIRRLLCGTYKEQRSEASRQ